MNRHSRAVARKPVLTVQPGPSLRVIDNPKAVRLLGYEDYRRFFMPLGWEETRKRQADGFYVSDPAHWARLAAGYHAAEAMLRPHIAAANAIAFCARCIELGEVS